MLGCSLQVSNSDGAVAAWAPKLIVPAGFAAVSVRDADQGAANVTAIFPAAFFNVDLEPIVERHSLSSEEDKICPQRSQTQSSAFIFQVSRRISSSLTPQSASMSDTCPCLSHRCSRKACLGAEPTERIRASDRYRNKPSVCCLARTSSSAVHRALDRRNRCTPVPMRLSDRRSHTDRRRTAQQRPEDGQQPWLRAACAVGWNCRPGQRSQHVAERLE